MNKQNTIRFSMIMLSGFFLFLDQFLKYQALNNWVEKKIILSCIGWLPYLNKGIAFGIKMPTILTIIVTLAIIVTIVIILWQERSDLLKYTSWILVLTGALSNLFDRVYYDYVVDYFLFVTGVINIADCLIVIGLILYLLTIFKKNSNCKTTNG